MEKRYGRVAQIVARPTTLLSSLRGRCVLRKPYSLWRRCLPSGKRVYYVRFRLDNGRWSVAKSSGQTKKGAAEAWALRYLQSGQVVLKENVTFASFAEGFFEPEGPYVLGLKLRGRSIGRGHSSNQQSYLTNYLIPAFGELKLSRIDSEAVEEFTQELIAKGLSSSSINHILLALKLVLQHAYKKKHLQQMPVIERVAHRQNDRGVLTIDEVKAFFGLAWADRRYYAMNLLAATTGMRLGEIRGLQRGAVHEDYIEVRTSWEKGHGLKTTKSGRARHVPVPERTRNALKEVLDTSPYSEPEDLVFYGRKRESPLDHKLIEKSFHAALTVIGIDEAERRRRRLCFHSWRHFFNSLLINGRVPVVKVQALTGHVSQRMTENYFHPDEYRDVVRITRRI